MFVLKLCQVSKSVLALPTTHRIDWPSEATNDLPMLRRLWRNWLISNWTMVGFQSDNESKFWTLYDEKMAYVATKSIVVCRD
jgi:hypothetical protein